MTGTWLRWTVALAAGVLPGQDGKPPAAGDGKAFQSIARAVHGALEKDEIWQGKIFLDGDVEVPKGRILTILPGTEIRIAATDTRKTGWRKDRIELHVMGTIRVQGTDESTVVIRPLDPPKDPAAVVWHGVVLRPEDPAAPRSSLVGMRLEHAFAGVQVPSAGPVIERSVFLNCVVGVEVGSAFQNRDSVGTAGGPASPEVRRCRFAGCKTGIYMQDRGSPDVQHSVFYRCGTGLGNSRPGLAASLRDPGAVVERCAFLQNGSGIVGQALVRNSIFQGNTTGMRLSHFHRLFSAQIDHVAMRSNLFHDNKAEVVGDTGLDSSPIHRDPKFAGPLENLAAPGVALPPCLVLNPESPARNRATDGGDLGPLGVPKGRIDEVGWTRSGALVPDLLALPADLGGSRETSVVGSRPVAGKRVGKTWVVRAPMGEQGVLDLAEVFGAKARGGWVAFTVEAAKAGKAKLEINGDLDRAVVYVNGKQSPNGVDKRRRFSVSGAIVELDVKSGRNTIYLQIDIWGRRPRLAFACAENLTPGSATAVKTAAIQVKKGRLVKHRDGNFLEFTMSAPLSWADTGRLGLFRILDGSGQPAERQERLDLEVVGIRKLRLLRVPKDWERPLRVEFTGLRSPKGESYGKAEYLLK